MIDGGISMSYDQLMLDCEFIRMIRRAAQGMSVTDETLAVDVIKAVGPVGNYLSQKHTIKHVRELSRASLIDRRMREPWVKDGSTSMDFRAHEKALKHFSEYKAPTLDPEVSAKLKKIIADAEAEVDADI